MLAKTDNRQVKVSADIRRQGAFVESEKRFGH
jgi:hypothetical protein